MKPGENLLFNGVLEADQADFPPFWNSNTKSETDVKWHPSGGPEGLPYFTINKGKKQLFLLKMAMVARMGTRP